MDLIQILILSFIEGFTEFLPISSTGHLILATRLLHISPTEFTKSFEIFIQLGAILSIVWLYLRTLFSKKELWLPLFAAFIPTAGIGFFVYPLVKSVFLESTKITLVSLLIGGIFIILIEKYYKFKGNVDDLGKITFKQAFLIGLVQSISIIPGVSRAAATIFGGLFNGLSRKVAVEFSFLLAVPTMFAATALDLYKSRSELSGANYYQLGIGFVLSFLFALISVKFLLKYIQKNSFIPFGVYRIILSVLFFLLLSL